MTELKRSSRRALSCPERSRVSPLERRGGPARAALPDRWDAHVELYSTVAGYAKARNHSFSGELRRLLGEAIEARQQTEKLADRLFR